MIGLSEKSGIEIESEYQLTGHPVIGGDFAKFCGLLRIYELYGKQKLCIQKFNAAQDRVSEDLTVL